MNNKLESIKLLAFDIHRPKWSHSVVARGHPARNCAQTNNTSKKIYGFFSSLPSSPSPNGEKNRENVASHPVIVRQHSFRRNSINVTKLCRVQLEEIVRISSSLYRWCNELYRESREQKPFYNTDSRLLANRSSSSVHRPPRLFSRSCPPFSPLHPCRIEGSVFSKSSDYPRGMGYIR